MNIEDLQLHDLKEQEIKRLRTPLTRRGGALYDCEGNVVQKSFWNGKPFLEPKQGILSDDEILVYAGDSKAAARIRLKRGTGGFSDKVTLYHQYFLYVILLFFPGIIFTLFAFWLWIAIVILVAVFFIYVLFIKDYTEPAPVETKNIEEENKTSDNDDLLLLFEGKEKVAREMIEKKFPAPQMTNTKFNGILDECREVIESQVSILNSLTLTEKTASEIDSRKKLITQLIGKVDDLTNELILSEENNLEAVIDEMDTLINSVKDYK